MPPVPATSEVRVKDPAMLFVLRQFFTTPTAIMAGFGPLDDQHTFLIRVQPGELNLGRLSALDEIAHLVPPAK